jgi:hypothetical protein
MKVIKGNEGNVDSAIHLTYTIVYATMQLQI